MTAAGLRRESGAGVRWRIIGASMNGDGASRKDFHKNAPHLPQG
jgi:hypothetical protein